MKLLLLVALLALAGPAGAARTHPEKHYQQQWCATWAGQTEVALADRSRVDCLTATHAVEADFADKWAQAIGQALHYGRLTGKRPGILVIFEKPDQLRHLDKLRPIADQVGITLYFAG